jgi:hypothetical protein
MRGGGAALAVAGAIALAPLSTISSSAGASGPGLRLALSTSHVGRGMTVTATLCNGKVAQDFHVAIVKKPLIGGSWHVAFAKAVPGGVATCTTRVLGEPVAGSFLYAGQLIRGASVKVNTGSHELIVGIPPRILWSASGSGDESGPKFTVPSGTPQWLEIWHYNCSSFGYKGNFITNVTGYGSAHYTTDGSVNELGAGGSGVNHYFDTGAFSIQVISECDWTETIEIPA